MCHLVTHCLVT